MFCSEAQTITARKRHRCTWCGEPIQPGEQYRRYACMDDGSALTVKMHPECYDDSGEVAREEGAGFEFMPYSQERPALAGTGGASHG